MFFCAYRSSKRSLRDRWVKRNNTVFFFGTTCSISGEGREEDFHLDNPVHVQQPMIDQVVKYFLDKGPNPCSAEEAIEVLRVMDKFTGKAGSL